MSHDGRYIVFNDVDKKLHLLDRATSSEVPLPGIDVYSNPGGLTVSSTDLIGFDDNGNGPALVYDSRTGGFVDTGLADDLDTGADPYVQDLGTRLDTGFPDDPNSDEEHPCIDADGSVFGIDKDPPGDMEPDIFLFDRSASPPQAIELLGLNTPDEPDAFCVLDPDGEYLGLFQNNTAFLMYHVPSQAFVALPPGKEFDNTSTFSAPYTPPGPAPGGNTTAPPAQDTTRPGVRRLRMTKRRFRVRRRATAFRFALTEPADVRIVIRRRGRRVGVLRRPNRPAGPNRIAFGGRLRGRKLRPGRYVAILTATDAAGNRTIKRIRFRILR